MVFITDYNGQITDYKRRRQTACVDLLCLLIGQQWTGSWHALLYLNVIIDGF